MRLVASGLRCDGEPIPVSRVMKRDPISVTPETSPTVAVRLMRMHHISALPVVKDGRLVGIVTERDFMEITADLLEAKLEEMQRERPQ
jgi:CBS domain-containing membrane protein